jgi:hypothetical protein
MKAIWSYQKSGSEWIKLILTSCIYDRLIEDWAVADYAIPNFKYGAKIHHGWAKTHQAKLPTMFDNGLALIRHPLDIAMSSYRYRKVVDMNLGDMSTYEYLLQFCGNQGDPTFNKINQGNLNDYYHNVKNDDRAIAVRYDHLVAEPGILWPCLALMGCDFKPTKVMDYVERMTPEYTRGIDKRNFLGKIRGGQYKVYVTPTLMEVYNEAFPEFRKAGYECENRV